MDSIAELNDIYTNLKIAGYHDMADKVACALSALGGVDPEEFSYSFIMRKLRKGKDETRLSFQDAFKTAFDDALDQGLENPEKVALMAGLVALKAIGAKDKGPGISPEPSTKHQTE